MKTSVPSHKGHRQVIQEIIEDHSLEHLSGPMDHVVPTRRWIREFRVYMESMIKGREGYGVPRFDDPGILTFTDGSKTKDYTGVGIALTKNNAFLRDDQGTPQIFKFRLRNVNSVYQSETWAIKKAAQMITDRINDDEDQNPDCIQEEKLSRYTRIHKPL